MQYRSLNLTLSVLESAMKFIDPEKLVNRSFKLEGSKLSIIDTQNKTAAASLDLQEYDSIYLVGAGKGTARMAVAVCNILKGRISGGAINVPYNTNVQIHGISITEAGHPIPDKSGINGTKKIVNILKQTKGSDLVFVLISGGGSALMPLPLDGLTLPNKQKITQAMMSTGASIEEINVVRKHLSKIKGGGLIRFLNNNCKVISLILSDVIGDNLATIASGPTVPDSSTFKDAEKILKKYHLWNSRREENYAAKMLIIKGIRGTIEDTPKPGDKIFQNVHNIIIGNNSLICEKAIKYLKKRGLRAMNLGSSFNGKAKNFGVFLSKLASDFSMSFAPFALVLGGETTVKLNAEKYNGIGGRNQEAILAAAINSKFGDANDITIVCMGTDGIDGNSNAAGALLTPKTLSIIKRKKINLKKYMYNHDSHSALKKLDSIVITGRTGTNVNDVAIICRLR
jgi:glycerate-2-kinase